ncbi:hypothetical protein BDFB_014201, partial [Asbolus verrucosus]
DPETIAREEKKNKKLKMDKDDEERTLEFVEKQVRLAQERGRTKEEPIYTELVRENEEEKLKLDLKLESTQKKEVKPTVFAQIKRSIDDGASTSSSTKKSKTENRKKTALDEIKELEEIKKEKNNRKDYWITEGIVVKVITKSLGDEYYKQKGVIREIPSKYVAIVKLLESGRKLKLDQEHLETVIPALGKLVKVVNGAYRGEIATLLSIDEKNYCVDIKIASGLLMGRAVSGVQYEDICKLYEEEQ